MLVPMKPPTMSRIGKYIAELGSRDSDSAELRPQKSLPVVSSAMMALLGIGWGLIYVGVGADLGRRDSLVVFGADISKYCGIFAARAVSIVSGESTRAVPYAAVLSRTIARWTRGFAEWCCGTSHVHSARSSLPAIATLAVSLLLDSTVADRVVPSELTIERFLVLNIAGVSLVVFVLLQFFTIQREAAQEMSGASSQGRPPRDHRWMV